MACPICAKTAVFAYRPFCSRRCADVDLGRWLRGSYALPGQPLEESQPHGDEKSASGPLDSGSRRP